MAPCVLMTSLGMMLRYYNIILLGKGHGLNPQTRYHLLEPELDDNFISLTAHQKDSDGFHSGKYSITLLFEATFPSGMT